MILIYIPIKRYIIILISLLISTISYADDISDRYYEMREREIYNFNINLFENGEYYRAITEAKRYLFNFPKGKNTEEMHKLIGDCYFISQEWDKAILNYSEFIEKYPTSQLINAVLFNKAISLVEKKSYKEAKTTFSQIIYNHDDNKKKEAILWHALISINQNQLNELEGFLRDDLIKEMVSDKVDIIRKTEYVKKNITYKSPAIAGTMSAILPGSGQCYNERYKDGLISFILNSLFIFGAYKAFENDNPAAGAIMTIFEMGWYTGNVYSAVNGAYKYNRKIDEDIFKKSIENFGLLEYPVKKTPTITIMFRFRF